MIVDECAIYLKFKCRRRRNGRLVAPAREERVRVEREKVEEKRREKGKRNEIRERGDEKRRGNRDERRTKNANREKGIMENYQVGEGPRVCDIVSSGEKPGHESETHVNIQT